MTIYNKEDLYKDIQTDLDALNVHDDLFYIRYSDDGIEVNPNAEVNYATGASKLVILYDEVVCKVPVTKIAYDEKKLPEETYESENYCALEEDNYSAACAEGLEKAFAEVKELNKWFNGLPVYIAEKAEPLPEVLFMKEEVRQSVKDSINSDDLSWDWGESLWCAFVSYYGLEFCKRLSNFCIENSINDICYRNCGMINGRPVLIDYSGYDY